jgi:hypothetical protein
MSNKITAASFCLVLFINQADAKSIPGWGRLATGNDMRRSHLHDIYCKAAMEHALWAAQHGHLIENSRCW